MIKRCIVPCCNKAAPTPYPFCLDCTTLLSADFRRGLQAASCDDQEEQSEFSYSFWKEIYCFAIFMKEPSLWEHLHYLSKVETSTFVQKNYPGITNQGGLKLYKKSNGNHPSSKQPKVV